MKRLHVVAAVVALTVGMIIGSILNNDAIAQQPAASPPMAPRYQVSAFASTGGGGGVFHGCYQVDTVTGELWLVIPGQPTTKVSNAPQR